MVSASVTADGGLVFPLTDGDTMTTTNGHGFSNCIDYAPYVQCWYPQTVHWYVTYPQMLCIGDTHVFKCEHADRCQCGKTMRAPDPNRCAACGK